MAGSGAPVMFFPGVAGLFWDDFLERLSQHHTVYALKYPGTGSTSPQSIYQIDILWHLVLVCDEILDALGLTSIPQAAGLARAQFLWALGCTAKFVWPVPDRGLKKRIHRVKAPTLVIWGQQDALIPPIYAGEFVSRRRGARMEIVPEAGHTPQLEQVDTVAALVLDFVASKE